MKITKTIFFDHGTADLAFSLARQRVIDLQDGTEAIVQTHREAVAPGQFDRLQAFFDDYQSIEGEAEGLADSITNEGFEGIAKAGIMSLDTRMTQPHPLMAIIQALWTDEVVDSYNRKYSLGEYAVAVGAVISDEEAVL